MIHPPSQLLELLGGASWRAAALTLLLLALRPWLRRALGSPLLSLLWLVVLARLLVPWSAESAWHPWTFPSRVMAPLAEAGGPWKVRVSVREGMGGTMSPHALAVVPPRVRQDEVLFGIWAVGCMVALIFFGARSWRTRGLVRRAVSADDPRLRRIFLAIPGSIRRRAELRITDDIPVAALAGIWRPRILLPREWTAALSDAELGHVLLHELGHARRGDLVRQWLFALAQCLHWFNPLVWLASRWARADAELACDAWVLTHSREQERPSYGHTLLRTSQLFREHGSIAPMAIGMAANRDALVARVRAVGAFRPVAPWQNIAGLLVASVVAGALMTRPTTAQETPAAAPAPATPQTAETKPAANAEPAATPKPKGAKPTEPGPAGPSTQVEIEAKFFELTEASGRELDLLGSFLNDPVAAPSNPNSPFPTALPPVISISGVMAEDQATKLVKKLMSTKGVDLVAAPRVTTKSGLRAVVEMVREFRYPTEFTPDKKSGTPVPTAFETRNLGITMETEPTIGPDGYTIDLTLVPQVVELEGFVGTDGQTVPLRGGRSVGANMTLSDMAGASQGKHGVLQPLFSTRKVSTSVSIWSGQTVLLGGFKRELKTDGKAAISRLLYVLVSARFVDANLARPAAVSPPAPPIPNPNPPTDAKINDADTPVATAVPDKPGFIISPFAPQAGYIDVRGFPAGTVIKCPYTGKTFKTP